MCGHPVDGVPYGKLRRREYKILYLLAENTPSLEKNEGATSECNISHIGEAHRNWVRMCQASF
jgi:hypothetical protein